MKKDKPDPREHFCTVRKCDQPATQWLIVREDDGLDVKYARCDAHSHSVKV